MTRSRLAAPLTLIGMLLAHPAAAEPVASGHAATNGLDTYYELHGGGDPVVVLHGAYMSTASMRPVVERLAEHRQVLVMDLQGHGRTGDADRPITYEGMADDVDALMATLDLAQADVFGYSMGGGVAWQLAIRHPDRIRRLAVASASIDRDGVYPELWEKVEQITPEAFAGTPWEAEYKAVAPDPDAFPTLVEKLVALDSRPFDWPEDAVRAIEAPTLVISGDADIVRPEHSVELFRLRGGGPSADFMTPGASELAILPGTTHLGVIEQTDLLSALLNRFFDKAIGD